jgi:hypothetical protein
MSIPNIFQQYSRQENTITNNVLLLFSKLYENNPAIYEHFFNGLLGEENICSVMPSFGNQFNNGAAIVVGQISSKSSTVVIVTKRKGKANLAKLISFCDRFKTADSKIMLHISSDVFDLFEIHKIKKEIAKIDKYIRFFSITFENIADSLTALTRMVPNDQVISSLEKDFRNYCELSGLFIVEPYIMRAVACEESNYLNADFFFYFEPAGRSYRPHKYLGIYYDKSVKMIGEIKAIVTAELVKGKVTILKVVQGQMDAELFNNLEEGIKISVRDGWKINKGYKFFLCYTVFNTDFLKTSDYGIFGNTYFDLRKILNTNQLPDTETIADMLTSITWE